MNERAPEITDILHTQEEIQDYMIHPNEDIDAINNLSQHSETTSISHEILNNSNSLSQSVITNKKENNPFGNILDNNKPPNTIS
jgi:D-ribose pyranose/furanose isomerase RbsD